MLLFDLVIILLYNVLSVARQVKTIKYQLSSQMCLNEGWTIRPPSPVLPDDDNDVFTPEPLDPAMIADGKVCVYLYIVVVKL